MFPKAVHPNEPPSLADGLDRSPISSFTLSPLSSLSIVNNNIFVEFNYLNNSLVGLEALFNALNIAFVVFRLLDKEILVEVKSC